MKRICILIACALFSLSRGESGTFHEVNRDSLAPYQNIVVYTSAIPVIDDTSYCREMKNAPKGTLEKKRGTVFSSFQCGQAIVSEFTFSGYEGDDVLVLFKPDGTDAQYFGRARFKRGDLEKIHSTREKPEPTAKDSETQLHRMTGAIATTTLVIAVIGILYLVFLGI